MLQQNPSSQNPNRYGGSAEFYDDENVNFRASELEQSRSPELTRIMGEVVSALDQPSSVDNTTSLTTGAALSIEKKQYKLLTPELIKITGAAIKRFREKEIEAANQRADT